jgi:hypothetical protein
VSQNRIAWQTTELGQNGWSSQLCEVPAWAVVDTAGEATRSAMGTLALNNVAVVLAREPPITPVHLIGR